MFHVVCSMACLVFVFLLLCRMLYISCLHSLVYEYEMHQIDTNSRSLYGIICTGYILKRLPRTTVRCTGILYKSQIGTKKRHSLYINYTIREKAFSCCSNGAGMIRRYCCFAWHRVPRHMYKWWLHYPLSLLYFVLRILLLWSLYTRT